MFWLVLSYVVVFLVLTATDIGTTLWAISIGAGQEFNHVLATSEGLLQLERMLVLNGGMLIFTAGMLIWALRKTDRIDLRYLDRPERAMFNYIYLNPFSTKNTPKAALHYLALPFAILFVKVFASVNNSLIALKIPDLATPLAMWIRTYLGEGPATYWAVILVLFHPMWWAALRITTAMIKKKQSIISRDHIAA